jgi:hypothetical protein
MKNWQKCPIRPSFSSNKLYWIVEVVRVMKSRRVRWAGHVARMGKTRPLGRPGRRWEGNIKIDLKVSRWGGMD